MPKVVKQTSTQSQPTGAEINKNAPSVIEPDFDRRYACPECEKTLSCGSSLKRHLSLKHEKEMTLKFGRTYKGGRSLSNHRYYLKTRKLKTAGGEKSDQQRKRSAVNQRSYQKKVFKLEAEDLKKNIISKTGEMLRAYLDTEDLRVDLAKVASDKRADHSTNMYVPITQTLGLPDTFQTRYSIAFYFILAIANRLPTFVNLDYNKKEVAFGLCGQNTEYNGIQQDNFEYDENFTNALFATLDNYFLGKGKKVKELKLDYMTKIGSFLNTVFTACENRLNLIKRESMNPCYLLRSLFNQPLNPLPPADRVLDSDKPEGYQTPRSIESPSIESPSIESPSIESPSIAPPSIEPPSIEPPSIADVN